LSFDITLFSHFFFVPQSLRVKYFFCGYPPLRSKLIFSGIIIGVCFEVGVFHTANYIGLILFNFK
jgi:hypothetical protein